MEPQKEEEAKQGLRYYVPRDVMHVRATATFNMARGWKDKTSCDAGPEVVKLLKTVATEVQSATVPDRRTAFRLAMEPSSSAAQTFKLAVSSDGLLTSVNYSVEDKRAEIAGNLLKSVAGIAGSVVGIDALLPLQVMGKIDSIKSGGRKEELHAALARDRGEKCAFQADPKRMGDFLQAREQLEKDLERAHRDRREALSEVRRVASEGGAKLLQSRDELHARRIAVIDARLATVRDAIAAQVAALKADKGIVAKDSVIVVDAAVDLVQVPVNDVVKDHLNSLSAAHAALKGYPEVQRLLDSARVIVTVEELKTPGDAAPPPLAVKWKSKGCDVDADTAAATQHCLHIYSRAPKPRVLRLYVPTGGAPDSPLALKETRIVSLVSSTDPVVDVPISTRTLGQQTFAMTFARPGTLTGFEQTTTAGLATATNTLATALTGARQEFLAGLTTVQTAQTTVDAMQAQVRASRLKELQDQKALVEAQLALQGTTANQDLVAQKQQLEAQIALLASQQALVSAQQAATVNGDVAAMKAEIQRIQAQIDLLKTQLELEKARKEAGSF